MKKQDYESLIQFFSRHPFCLSLLRTANKGLSFSAFVLYPLLLGWKMAEKNKEALALFFCPAFFFTTMGIIRKLIGRKRPYEQFDFIPAIHREGKGESFPSRHVFSIFLIATLWAHYLLPLGIFLYICGVFLALARVLGGVHFPGDVFWGAIIGTVCGLLILLLL
ncbi:MAG: phosphatase PAP2 family protein [Eubacteriales bacterium]|nr:phosphatase PAP2 family protein [Eubacteriales bacterium]